VTDILVIIHEVINLLKYNATELGKLRYETGPGKAWNLEEFAMKAVVPACSTFSNLIFFK